VCMLVWVDVCILFYLFTQKIFRQAPHKHTQTHTNTHKPCVKLNGVGRRLNELDRRGLALALGSMWMVVALALVDVNELVCVMFVFVFVILVFVFVFGSMSDNSKPTALWLRSGVGVMMGAGVMMEVALIMGVVVVGCESVGAAAADGWHDEGRGREGERLCCDDTDDDDADDAGDGGGGGDDDGDGGDDDDDEDEEADVFERDRSCGDGVLCVISVAR